MSGSVFITGISGFIGRAVAMRMRDEGWRVSGVSRGTADVPGCEVVAGDVADLDGFRGQLEGADVVLHLAAPTTYAEINDNPVSTLRANVGVTQVLLEAFARGAGKQFIYLSSGKVYGPPEFLPISELHPLQPNTVLGRTKKLAEELLDFVAGCTPKQFTSVRLFNAYGPGQKNNFLVPSIMRQVPSGRIELGDTRSKRDFIYIDDVVWAILVLIHAVADNIAPKKFETFNVGSGASNSPADIVETLSGITGTPLEIVVNEGRMRAGEADEERAATSKLGALGWEPRFSLREGLEETWRSFNCQLAKKQ